MLKICAVIPMQGKGHLWVFFLFPHLFIFVLKVGKTVSMLSSISSMYSTIPGKEGMSFCCKFHLCHIFTFSSSEIGKGLDVVLIKCAFQYPSRGSFLVQYFIVDGGG